MSVKGEVQEYRLDLVKWVLVGLIVAAGVYGNLYFAAEPLLYRVVALIFFAAIACAIAYNTAKGASFWGLLQGSMVELRKVVWPTRQETNQTTLIVVAVVFVMSIILWLLDTFFGWIAAGIIG